MIDRWAAALLRPGLQAGARGLVRAGVGADAVTWAGFALGLAAAVCIAWEAHVLGLVLMLMSRLLDGLDGAVARLTAPTDRGAFLDITLDFLFYASIPLAFAWADPSRNALAAATLLAAFVGTGSTFLAFAVLAQRRGLTSAVYPTKGLYYLGGLTEATETLLVFAAMCWWPQAFATLAFVFAGLCGLTVLTRLWAGWRMLAQPLAQEP
ncbi:MAG: CDP-alcohol phosphatidyltransferase family protein [Rubrivivax sp.]|jgi:phosphatidylglycerophosphate synthase